MRRLQTLPSLAAPLVGVTVALALWIQASIKAPTLGAISDKQRQGPVRRQR